MIGMLFGRVIIRFRRFDALFLVGGGRSVTGLPPRMRAGFQVKAKLIPAAKKVPHGKEPRKPLETGAAVFILTPPQR
jgi:hypothetical protein